MYDYFAILWFLFSCMVVRISYDCVDYMLNRHGLIKYRQLPKYRQRYIQKNIVKSVSLVLLLIYAMLMTLNDIYHNKWDNYVLHRIAVMYVSNDFTALLCIEKLPQTTIIHHCISSLFVLASLSLDFETSDIAQAMFIYCLSSASAYIVNLHLAFRFLFDKSKLELLRRSAATIYLLACLCSWSWHVIWACTRPNWTVWHFLYILFLFMIVRDDLVLINHLIR